MASRAARHVRRQTRVLLCRLATGKLILDVLVQDLEASGAAGVDGAFGEDRVDVEVAVSVHEIPVMA